MTPATLQLILVNGTAGFILGLLYFGGLWWTTRRVAGKDRPGMFLLVSFLIRVALLLGGIYFITRGEPLATLVAVGGVVVARVAAVQWAKARPDDQGAPKEHDSTKTTSPKDR